MREAQTDNDSRKRLFGRIPGTPGLPAFSLSGSDPSTIPVLLAVPHAGRAYPGGLLKNMRRPSEAALKLEDRYADRLAMAAAQQTGATLMIANAPRAMIDLNRAPHDVDWEMFVSAGATTPANVPSRRARSGLGLIPRRVPGIGELWKQRHEEADLTARISSIHEPYHDCLAQTLVGLRNRWGAAILLDIHSMPPISAGPGLPGPEFVLGDRFGSTCHGGLVASAFACFNAHERKVAHNRPYSGGYVLERHAAPESGIHALQIEIDRSSYLDSRLSEPGGGFDSVVSMLSELIENLAGEASNLAGLGDDSAWPEAAE